MNVIGDVRNKDTIILDDMVDTGGTTIQAAEALKGKGAKRVVAACTHAVLSGDAIEKVNNSVIEELIVTNTINHDSKKEQCKKLTVLSIASLIGEAIKRIHEESSISSLVCIIHVLWRGGKMERITINVEKREETGKGAARSLRRKDMIPAVLYRGGGSLPIKLPKKEITQFINTTCRRTDDGEPSICNDGESKLALMKEFQVDPIRRELLHADFFEVSLTEKLKVNVHISLTGEPIGVKRDGGILQYHLRDIEIECLPDKMPGHVDIDVSGLEIGQSLHVRDLKLGEDIKVLTDPGEVIVNVIAPLVEAAAPTEEAAPAEAAEPEVMKKGKKEEEKAEEEKK